MNRYSGPKRYLSDRQQDEYQARIAAAKTYLTNIGPSAEAWLFGKPYDATPGNPYFYTLLYNVLNLLKAMDLPLGASVLEVGSGPGWITEILIALGFHVWGIEPSEEMIRVAEQRVAGMVRHRRIQNPPEARFLCLPLEECPLPDGCVDGVLFNEALHHVVDEEKGLAQCARVLAPGGVLGVTGEAEWRPGRGELEDECDKEMARYGTLENPYCFEYLEHLLLGLGFEGVTRYHGVNGFFPVSRGGLTIAQAAQSPAGGCNHLTAWKAHPAARPTTASGRGRTAAELAVLGVTADARRRGVVCRVRATNVGETVWLNRPRPQGWVTLALVQGDLTAGQVEADPRNRLPRPVAPGETVEWDATFYLPTEASPGPWHLDLVNEGAFWFSANGSLTRPRLDIRVAAA